MTAIHCYAHRPINIPMTNICYQNEIKVMKQLLFNNKYDINLIYKIIDKVKHKKQMSQEYPVANENYNFELQISEATTNKLPDLKISLNCQKNMKTLFPNFKKWHL